MKKRSWADGESPREENLGKTQKGLHKKTKSVKKVEDLRRGKKRVDNREKCSPMGMR